LAGVDLDVGEVQLAELGLGRAWTFSPRQSGFHRTGYLQHRRSRSRLGTTDAEAAHARLRDAGVTLHNVEVIHLEGTPPMFFFADPDGNGLVYLEEPPGGTDDS